MKQKASIAYLTVFLCAALLPILSLASAQNARKSMSAQKPKSAPAVTPTPTPTLEGSYTLIDPVAATDTVKREIDASAGSVAFGFRDMAKSELTETNLPLPRRISISYTATKVRIRTDVAGNIETPLDGSSVPWTKYQVSTKWVNGDLERTFKSSKGQRVNTYILSADGQTLTMKVLATRDNFPKLNRPLEYQLDYRRN